MVNISQYTVVLLDDPHHPDVFQLTDDTRGKSYSVKLLVFACFQKRSIIYICNLASYIFVKIVELPQVFFGTTLPLYTFSLIYPSQSSPFACFFCEFFCYWFFITVRAC